MGSIENDLWNMDFAERLKFEMFINNYDQSHMAKAVGVTPQAISLYCLGKATPSLRVAQKLAEELNCSIYDLLPNL